MDDALATARELALVSQPAFRQTKSQIRQPVRERLRLTAEATDKAVTEIWTAPVTLEHIRDYVARTLGKK